MNRKSFVKTERHINYFKSTIGGDNRHFAYEEGSPAGFINGVFIPFEKPKIKKDKLSVESRIWHGSLGANGDYFVVEKEDGI